MFRTYWGVCNICIVYNICSEFSFNFLPVLETNFVNGEAGVTLNMIKFPTQACPKVSHALSYVRTHPRTSARSAAWLARPNGTPCAPGSVRFANPMGLGGSLGPK